jgi:hypothetical protein
MDFEILSYVCPYCECEVRVGEPCSSCTRKVKRTLSKKRLWEHDKSADGLDLPDEDFDYEDYVAREFGNAPHRTLGLKWYWWLLAVGVLSGMIASVFWL